MKTLNDLMPVGTTEIWYSKPNDYQFDSYEMRKKTGRVPDKNNLTKTHVLLGKIAQTSLEEIYGIMQGENWSPKGEARELIKTLGLWHTSMSVGDIIKIGDKVWLVDMIGFVEL